MSLYFQTLMDPDVLSRIILKNDVALHLNGPANEQGRMDFQGALSNVTCPVLVMAGREDPVTPLSMNEGIVASLPDGAAFKVFDKCGHGVVGDRPEEAFAAIRSFIADIT